MSTLTRPAINVNSYAFTVGASDATAGESCVPEMIYIRRADQVSYAAGWESVKGVTATSSQFTGSALPIIVPNKRNNDRERVRRTDGDANTIFRAGEARGKRLAKMVAMTADFLGGNDGDMIFAA